MVHLVDTAHRGIDGGGVTDVALHELDVAFDAQLSRRSAPRELSSSTRTVSPA